MTSNFEESAKVRRQLEELEISFGLEMYCPLTEVYRQTLYSNPLRIKGATWTKVTKEEY